MRCSNIDLNYSGKCCECRGTTSYVCGTDGVTYDNTCKLSCAGAKPDYTGKCRKSSALDFEGPVIRRAKSVNNFMTPVDVQFNVLSRFRNIKRGFKGERIPIVVQMKVPDNAEVIKQGIDLVIAVDTSGSMSG